MSRVAASGCPSERQIIQHLPTNQPCTVCSPHFGASLGLISPLVGLVPYDGDDSQSESEATHDIKARSIAAPESDNVRVTISGLAVAVSLLLAVPPFASGLRAKVRQ